MTPTLQLRDEQIRALYSQAVPALGMGLLVAILLTAQLWQRVDHGWLIPWIISLLLLTASRFGLIHAFHKTKPTANLARWAHLYTAGAIVGGSLWGSSALFLELTSSMTDQLVIFIVLAGISAAAIPANASYLAAYLGFAGPALLPLAGWILFQQNSDISRSLAPISLIFMTLLIFAARNYHRNLTSSLSLRLENLALVESLSRNETVLEEAQRLAGLGSWVLEVPTQHMKWSDEQYRLFGYHPGEIETSYDRLLDSIHPADQNNFRITLERVTEGHDQACILEHRVRHADGSERYMLHRGKAMIDTAGRPHSVVGTMLDVTENRLIENRLRKQQIALWELATNPAITGGEVVQALRLITEAATGTLGVERASVWLYQAGRSQLSCADLYQHSQALHSADMLRSADDYPGYFQAIARERTIAAEDARNNPDLMEFSDSYLKPLDINALLDTPIRRGGETIGVICHEHVGPARHWNIDEQNFAASLADMVSLVIEQQDQCIANQELQLAASVFSNSLQAIMITDKKGCILKVNPAFTQITGYTSEEAIGDSPRLFRSHQHDELFYKNLWRTLNDTGRWQGEIWNRRKNGEIFPIWQTITSVRNKQGEVIRYISIFDDISEQKEWEKRIHHLAFFDALTELPNRRLFEERLSHGLDLVRRTKQRLALLLVDLDRFKAVNDTLGHPIGDQLLRQVATRLRHCVREEDTVARLGGDEFAVILENLNSSSDTESVARKVLAKLSSPVMLEGKEIVPSASIGISIYPDDGKDTETLIRNADTALYKAKDQGRNGYQFYAEEMSKAATEHLTLEIALRQALDHNELTLNYQPQYSSTTGHVVGLEALARWKHATMGTISPGRFIPVAEESGLIIPLSEWALNQALSEWKGLMEKVDADARLSVNISSHHFRRSGLVELVAKSIDRYDIDARYLELEITESAIMQDADAATPILEGLKDLGVRIAIDDFGTGYSSLSYLRRFPIDVVKIDRSFVRDIGHDFKDASLVYAIINMCHSLNLEVVAEGVESEQQLALLTEHGCDTIQGFLCGRPVPIDQLPVPLSRPQITCKVIQIKPELVP